MTLYLRQKWSKPVTGALGAGPYTTWDWSIDRRWPDVTRVGSWQANYYFPVATGKSDRDTLSHAKQALVARARRVEETCTFEYIEE